MKIGFDAKRAFLNRSGLGEFSRNLLGGLLQFEPGPEYHFYTPRMGDEELMNFMQGGQGTVHLPPKRYPRILHSYWRSYKLAEQLQGDGLDIYHGLSNELPVGIQKTGIKTVVTLHDVIFKRYPDHYPRLDRPIYDAKSKYACEKADIIHAISEQTKQDLIEFYKAPADKIRVVYQAAHPRYYNEVPTEELQAVDQHYKLPDNYILNVSAFHPRKNHIRLIKAFQQIMDKVDAQLILVGDGRTRKTQVEKYIAEYKLGDRVRIITGVPAEQLPALYQMAQLFVYPSLFEGFGIPIIEAMYCKTPVVTSTGSCFSEAGGPAATYVDPKNVEALAQEILKVYSNHSLAEEMRQEGFEWVQQFKCEFAVKKIKAIYDELI